MGVSAALSGRNSIPDGSGAPLWYAPSTSSVRTKTQAAWPESWTVLFTEMRSFQCRCFWNMLPDDSVLSQSFKQAGWDVALSLDTNLNPDFNLQNPFFFAVAVGLLLGTAEFAFLRCCNPDQVGAIATASERVLDSGKYSENICEKTFGSSSSLVRTFTPSPWSST